MDLQEIKEALHTMYGGENKPITDGNYDKTLSAKCVNGTFVGKKEENIISYKGIPFVGQQPVGDLRWKAPVDVMPNDGGGLLVSELVEVGRHHCQEAGHRVDLRWRF